MATGTEGDEVTRRDKRPRLAVCPVVVSTGCSRPQHQSLQEQVWLEAAILSARED